MNSPFAHIEIEGSRAFQAAIRQALRYIARRGKRLDIVERIVRIEQHAGEGAGGRWASVDACGRVAVFDAGWIPRRRPPKYRREYRGVKGLARVLFHEAVHICFPQMSESEVSAAEVDWAGPPPMSLLQLFIRMLIVIELVALLVVLQKRFGGFA